MPLSVLGSLAREVPPCRTINVIDDLAGHIIGGPETAVKAAGQVCALAQQGMEEVKLPISWDKCFWLCSGPHLVQKVLESEGFCLGMNKCVLAHRGLEQRSAEASWDSTHQSSGGQKDGCPSVYVRL
eukprot:8122582-Pyramimonas_sp.AAC.1